MVAYSLALLKGLKADRKGVTALEYGVIASLIIVALVASFRPLSAALGVTFGAVTAAL